LALKTKGRFGSVLRAAILTRKAALDAAAGAKPNPRAFLAENHVTGIKNKAYKRHSNQKKWTSKTALSSWD
jgi:hypothetical protein